MIARNTRKGSSMRYTTASIKRVPAIFDMSNSKERAVNIVVDRTRSLQAQAGERSAGVFLAKERSFGGKVEEREKRERVKAKIE